MVCAAHLEDNGEDCEGEEPDVVQHQLRVQQPLAPVLKLEVYRGLRRAGGKGSHGSEGQP